MRLRPLLFVIVLSLAVLGVAQSAPAQVAGEKQGVTIVRGGHGYVFRFSKRAAKVYRQIAGRRVTVACSTVTKSRGNFVTEDEVSGRVRVPRKGRRVPGVASGTDFCVVRLRNGEWVAVAPITADGRTYLDERFAAASLEAPFIVTGTDAENPPPAALVLQRGRGHIIALDGPDGSPPAGKIGYWTDGVRSVSAVLSAAGRRLFIDFEGDVFRTNVLPYLIPDG